MASPAYHAAYYRTHRERYNELQKIARQRGKAFLDGVKLYYGCANPACCWNGDFKACQLEFHHLDPEEKSYNIATKYQCPISTLVREIHKCCVLCSNCHRIETWGDLDASKFTRCNLTPDGEPVPTPANEEPKPAN